MSCLKYPNRLEAIGAGSGPPIGHQDFAKIWQDSPEHAKIKEDIQFLSQPQTNSDNQNIHEVEYSTSFLYQMVEVCKRTSLAYYRSPSYGYTRVINHINVGLWIGLFYINIGNSRTDLQYRVFAVRSMHNFLRCGPLTLRCLDLCNNCPPGPCYIPGSTTNGSQPKYILSRAELEDVQPLRVRDWHGDSGNTI